MYRIVAIKEDGIMRWNPKYVLGMRKPGNIYAGSKDSYILSSYLTGAVGLCSDGTDIGKAMLKFYIISTNPKVNKGNKDFMCGCCCKRARQYVQIGTEWDIFSHVCEECLCEIDDIRKEIRMVDGLYVSNGGCVDILKITDDNYYLFYRSPIRVDYKNYREYLYNVGLHDESHYPEKCKMCDQYGPDDWYCKDCVIYTRRVYIEHYYAKYSLLLHCDKIPMDIITVITGLLVKSDMIG